MINTQLKLYQECTFPFYYLLRVHKSKSKTGVEFADACTDKRKPEFFFNLFHIRIGQLGKTENHQTF